jgi:predicted RNase H-like HicB family nuclease
MKAELAAIIEPAPEGGYWAICPEVPGANGQGETVEEAKRNLIEAIQLIFEDRRSGGCDTGKDSCRMKRTDLERRKALS